MKIEAPITRKANGESNREIAKDLGVSYKTVERAA